MVLTLCVAPATFAQSISSSTLRGVVRDSKGGLVPNATVKLVSVTNNAERQVTTNDDGAFVYTSVTPGAYKLRIEAPGFKAHEQTEFNLSPSDTRNLDVVLEVGAPNETVTVTGDAVPIKTNTVSARILTAKQLDNLSIIGRNGWNCCASSLAWWLGSNDLEFNSFGDGGTQMQTTRLMVFMA
jgi:hypothetical protein